MAGIKIQSGQAAVLINYLTNCLLHKPHSADAVKEYFIASNVQQVIFKLKQIIFKIQNHPNKYKSAKLKLTDNEVLALSMYFNRYQVHAYITPIEWDILELIPKHFPQLINLVSKHIKQVLQAPVLS